MTNSKSFQKRKTVASSTISLVRVNWPLTQSDNEFVPVTSSYISNMDHTANRTHWNLRLTPGLATHLGLQINITTKDACVCVCVCACVCVCVCVCERERERERDLKSRVSPCRHFFPPCENARPLPGPSLLSTQASLLSSLFADVDSQTNGTARKKQRCVTHGPVRG